MELSVLNINGQETGKKVTLNDAVFGIEPNDHVIYLDVKQYLANQRQGTAKSKERSEHSGSTRKLGRQKGGGGARRGDINSPVLVGALSYKAKDNEIIVVDNFDMEAPKTKDFVNIAKNLKVEGKKTLVVLPEVNKNVYLSARNLQKAEIMSANNINTYKILNADVLVIAEASLEMINSVLNK